MAICANLFFLLNTNSQELRTNYQKNNGNYIGFDPKKSVIHIKVQLALDFFRTFAIVYKTIAI